MSGLGQWINTPIVQLLIAAFSAFLVSWIGTYWVRSFAQKLGIVAKSDRRRRHKRQVPLLGGTPFYVSMVITTIVFMILNNSGGEPVVSVRFGLCFLAAISLIFFVGVLDDWKELKATPKIVAEVIAAVLILAGMPELPPLFQDSFFHPALIVPVLILWIVGVSNAMNMIDGLDGLCAGIGSITAITLMVIISGGGAVVSFPGMLTAVLAGVCIGFLLHNFNPAKIFLGDSGSLLIGFVLAVISINVEVKRSLFVSLSMPLFLLGVPLLDVVMVILRRSKLSRSLFQGDRSHIHHRLQQIGLSHRAVVLFLWGAVAYLNATAYMLTLMSSQESFYIYVWVIPTLVFWFISLYYLEYRLSQQAFQYSHMFVQQELVGLGDQDRLFRYVSEKTKVHKMTGEPYSVVLINCSHFMREMVTEQPKRVIAFYMDLYVIMRGRLRSDDFVARPADHVFAAVIPGMSNEDLDDSHLIRYLSRKIKALQENYGVFQSNNKRPEGFRVYTYPNDKKQIYDALKIDKATIKYLNSVSTGTDENAA